MANTDGSRQIHIHDSNINTVHTPVQSVMGILSMPTSRTLVPTEINLRHGKHHSQNKFFVVQITIQYPLNNLFKSKLPAEIMTLTSHRSPPVSKTFIMCGPSVNGCNSTEQEARCNSSDAARAANKNKLKQLNPYS